MSEQEQIKQFNGKGDEEGMEHSNTLVSRRKLLASLGIAGVSLAAGGLLGSTTGFIGKVEAAGVNVLTVSNIAALRAISTVGLAANDVYFIAGYYAGGDGGGGEFYWDAASTSADNGGTVILPTGYLGTGRWRRT